MALWHFDEGFGTTTADATGNARTGTLVNGPTWTASPVALPAGSALCFDGVSAALQVPNAALSMPTDEITMEFWERAYEVRQQSPFVLSSDNINNRISSHVPWSDGFVYWDFGNIGTDGRLVYLPPTDVTGRWQHWALVSSRAGNFQRIYRNGVLEASDSTAGQFVRYAATLIIGGSGFKGELDEFLHPEQGSEQQC